MMTILFITPGPSYDVNLPPFQSKYKHISSFCSGYIFSTSETSMEEKFWNFYFSACPHGSGVFAKIQYIIFCFKKMMRLKKQDVKIDLIITSDPILTGIIGIFFKFLLKARLIIEINGVFDSPFVWESAYGHQVSVLKKYFFPKLICFVLLQADGIKLLFPNQIDGFEINCLDKIVASYFDWTNIELFSSLCERKEVLCVGFPFKIKGIDILINAFKQIAGTHPDWYLKILGWYPDLKEIEMAIDGHPQIFHHPPVSAANMANHIGKCGFLVLPSRTEAMGRVLIEAMAAGKARIGSRIDGIPTVINDGIDGFLFEPENVQELAGQMDLLMRDEALREKLGAAGAVRAKKEFSAQAYVQLSSKFYHRVVAM